MLDAIETAVDALNNESAGWVTRRDAAETLGNAARNALAALQAHQEDKDTDVRRTVLEMLSGLGTPDKVVAPAPAGPVGLDKLAEACAKKGRREVTPDGDGFLITAQTQGGRGQKVYLKKKKRQEGDTVIRVFTRCGPSSEKVLSWVLTANSKLPGCAFALRKENGEEFIIVVQNIPLAAATPEAVQQAVKSVAYYGDWFEDKLTGEDTF